MHHLLNVKKKKCLLTQSKVLQTEIVQLCFAIEKKKKKFENGDKRSLWGGHNAQLFRCELTKQ